MSTARRSLQRELIVITTLKLLFIGLLWIAFVRGHALPVTPDRLLPDMPADAGKGTHHGL